MPEIIEKMTRFGNTAVRQAQEKNRRNGIPNVYCINGKIVWQLPDGSITDMNPLADDGNRQSQSFRLRRKEQRPPC